MAKERVEEYETQKYAIVNIRLSDGASVTIMECYGENAAKSIAAAGNAALPEGYESKVVKL